MITAENITNAQIDALWRECVHHPSHFDVEIDLAHDCTVAVNYLGDFTYEEQRDARARVAEILNTRIRVGLCVVGTLDTGGELRGYVTHIAGRLATVRTSEGWTFTRSLDELSIFTEKVTP